MLRMFFFQCRQRDTSPVINQIRNQADTKKRRSRCKKYFYKNITFKVIKIISKKTKIKKQVQLFLERKPVRPAICQKMLYVNKNNANYRQKFKKI